MWPSTFAHAGVFLLFLAVTGQISCSSIGKDSRPYYRAVMYPVVSQSVRINRFGFELLDDSDVLRSNDRIRANCLLNAP